MLGVDEGGDPAELLRLGDASARRSCCATGSRSPGTVRLRHDDVEGRHLTRRFDRDDPLEGQGPGGELVELRHERASAGGDVAGLDPVEHLEQPRRRAVMRPSSRPVRSSRRRSPISASSSRSPPRASRRSNNSSRMKGTCSSSCSGHGRGGAWRPGRRAARSGTRPGRGSGGPPRAGQDRVVVTVELIVVAGRGSRGSRARTRRCWTCSARVRDAVVSPTSGPASIHPSPS